MSRKIMLAMHVSLDGFVAGPSGEMDWIHINDEMFELVGGLTDSADTALYGRKTWEMMDGYWPTADQQPNATKHDIQHAEWYKRVTKLVISKSLENKKLPGTMFVGEHVAETIKRIKEDKGKNIVVFGSASVSHLLMVNSLVDDYWLFLNPVTIGGGIPLFKADHKMELKLVEAKPYPLDVVALHYRKPQ